MVEPQVHEHIQLVHLFECASSHIPAPRLYDRAEAQVRISELQEEMWVVSGMWMSVVTPSSCLLDGTDRVFRTDQHAARVHAPEWCVCV